jgi:anaerobic selenocysteine-containing dehydrogenase
VDKVKSDQFGADFSDIEEETGEESRVTQIKNGSSNSTLIHTNCNMNSQGCRVSVAVENGRIIEVRPAPADVAFGFCDRAGGILEWEYSNERLTKPLKRVGSSWQEITWDEAISFIAEKLDSIKTRYGARAVVLNTGQALVRNVNRRAAKRFAKAFGTPNFTSGDSFCFWSRAIGHTIALGIGDSAANLDLKASRCIMVIGHNPSESARTTERRILVAKDAGAKLIVVDPRVIPLAKKADIYAPIRPGTDCAFILSLLNVIITEELYDKDFVKRWTHGFSNFVEHVKSYPPEKVADITWIPADKIRQIARMYSTERPAALNSGIAIDHSTNGGETNWAIAILIAICGNYETEGGNYPVVRLIDQRNADQGVPEESIGFQYPVFSKICGESTVVPMADAILTGNPYPVKAFLTQCANPALTLPNSSKSHWALRNLELLVVMDLFMTETAKMADIVLPAANCLEVPHLKELGSFPPSFQLVPNVIEPRGECWPDWKFWTELGKKMGYDDDFSWSTTEEYFQHFLKPWGVSLSSLIENPQHVAFQPNPVDRSYRKNGFNTPSGKVELYSEYMENLGYDPMPTYHEPAEGWITKSELAEKYPLIMVSGTRNHIYHHTQYRNLSSIRKLYPEPMVEINTATARGLNISDGEMVTIESPRGSIRIKANLTDDIHPDVISVPHGWSEANVNLLTSDQEVDPVTAFIGFKSVLCRIIKD